jgi:excisionase family DNA binding protein
VSSDAIGIHVPARGADDDVYTMGEAARLKGVSYHTVSRAVRRGALPAQRIGKMVFITMADLQAWRPKYDRAPMQYRHRTPVPDAKPALIDLASGDRVHLAGRLATLLEVAEATARELSLDESLGLICERLAGMLAMRRVAIWSVDRQLGRASLLTAHGSPLADLPDRIELSDHPQFVKMIRRADGAVVINPPALGDRVPVPFRSLPSLLIATLRFGERAVGYVLADRNGAAFTLPKDDLALARGLAAHAALAVVLAEAREAGLTKVATGKARLARAASA